MRSSRLWRHDNFAMHRVWFRVGVGHALTRPGNLDHPSALIGSHSVWLRLSLRSSDLPIPRPCSCGDGKRWTETRRGRSMRILGGHPSTRAEDDRLRFAPSILRHPTSDIRHPTSDDPHHRSRPVQAGSGRFRARRSGTQVLARRDQAGAIAISRVFPPGSPAGPRQRQRWPPPSPLED